MTWQTIAAELAVSAWLFVLLAADVLLGPSRRRQLWLVALAGVALVAALLWWERAWIGQTFGLMFVLDQFAWLFKWLFLIVVAVVILMTRAAQESLARHAAEFYVLLFTGLLGMLVLASVNDLLLLFIGLELLTFSIYVMAAYLKQDKRSVEAGLKYLIMGSISSGFLVYDLAILYGFAGGTRFDVLRAAIHISSAPMLASVGMLLLMAALGFKIGAVPFQLWVPDVYEGAPTPVVAFLSVGSKMAGIVALMRVLYGVFYQFQSLWGPVLVLLSAMTIVYGNLGALLQTNVKRLLGYSSIGHAGYLLMGLATGSLDGVAAVAYYLLAYALSTLTIFLVLTAAADQVGGEALDDYKGFAKRSGGLAAAMFIGLLSLAGVPPLAGFVGKLLVLLRTVEQGRLWLAALGAVNVAISLYYYLMVVKRMYLDAPRTATPIRVSRLTTLTLAGLVIGIFAVGIFQEPFVRLIASALQP